MPLDRRLRRVPAAAVAAAGLALTACNGGGTPTEEAEPLATATTSTTALALRVGDTASVSITTTPALSSTRTVTWSSSQPTAVAITSTAPLGARVSVRAVAPTTSTRLDYRFTTPQQSISGSVVVVVISSGTLDPNAVEDVLDNALKTHHHDDIRPADTLQGLADALPALGIVAAVLGVVKTMGSIDKPPAILGAMIGSALVGTFMGVLLAYGIVGPFASRCRQVVESDAAIYHVVKQIIIASLHGHPLPLVIEAARSSISHSNQPAFADVFDGMRGR